MRFCYLTIRWLGQQPTRFPAVWLVSKVWDWLWMINGLLQSLIYYFIIRTTTTKKQLKKTQKSVVGIHHTHTHTHTHAHAHAHAHASPVSRHIIDTQVWHTYTQLLLQSRLYHVNIMNCFFSLKWKALHNTLSSEMSIIGIISLILIIINFK